MVNVSPMLLSVLLSFTPTSKATGCMPPSSMFTDVVIRSMAVISSVGSNTTPLHVTLLTSVMVNVFSGIIGSSYFSSPSFMAYVPVTLSPSSLVYVIFRFPPPRSITKLLRLTSRSAFILAPSSIFSPRLMFMLPRSASGSNSFTFVVSWKLTNSTNPSSSLSVVIGGSCITYVMFVLPSSVAFP